MNTDQKENNNSNNSNEVLNSYKNLLNAAQTVGSYFVIFLTFTVIFGIVHLYSFLVSSDLAWLFSSIEYRTILSWGTPISLIIFSVWVIFITIHFFISNNNLVKIGTILLLIGLIIVVIYTKQNGYNYYMSYVMIALASIPLFAYLSEIISYKLNTSWFLEQMTTTLMIIVTFIFLITIILLSIIMLGWSKNTLIEKGYYPAYAVHDKQLWGVILNNGSSTIITDMKDTSKIKIIETKDIQYFIQRKEYMATSAKDSNTSDENNAHGIDHNKTKK